MRKVLDKIDRFAEEVESWEVNMNLHDLFYEVRQAKEKVKKQKEHALDLPDEQDKKHCIEVLTKTARAISSILNKQLTSNGDGSKDVSSLVWIQDAGLWVTPEEYWDQESANGLKVSIDKQATPVKTMYVDADRLLQRADWLTTYQKQSAESATALRQALERVSDPQGVQETDLAPQEMLSSVAQEQLEEAREEKEFYRWAQNRYRELEKDLRQHKNHWTLLAYKQFVERFIANIPSTSFARECSYQIKKVKAILEKCTDHPMSIASEHRNIKRYLYGEIGMIKMFCDQHFRKNI